MIENWQDVELTMNAVVGAIWTRLMPPMLNNIPGRFVLQLTPGHYEFIHSGSKGRASIEGKITVDIKAGESLVSPMYKNQRYDEYVYPLQPPAGCPGGPIVFLSPTPVPTVGSCPVWFATPEPNKGILIFENYFNNDVDVVGVSGINLDAKVTAKKGENPGRLVLQLNAGNYSIDIRPRLNVTFAIATGQVLVAPFSPSSTTKVPIYEFQVPSSCP